MKQSFRSRLLRRKSNRSTDASLPHRTHPTRAALTRLSSRSGSAGPRGGPPSARLTRGGGEAITVPHRRSMPATPKLPPAAVKPAAPVIPVDVEAIRLLHWASQTGDAAQVQRLVDRGVPIDAKVSKQGWTPLLLASHGGHMVRLCCRIPFFPPPTRARAHVRHRLGVLPCCKVALTFTFAPPPQSQL